MRHAAWDTRSFCAIRRGLQPGVRVSVHFAGEAGGRHYFPRGRINMQHCPDDMAQELIDMGKRMPIVLVNGNIPKGGFHRVYTDEGAGAVLAAEHLLELGHRDIAFVGGLRELSTTMVKVKAVQKNCGSMDSKFRKNASCSAVSPSMTANGRCPSCWSRTIHRQESSV